MWLCFDRATGQLVGQSGLAEVEGTTQIEVYYALGTAYWGKGFATEAARAAVAFAFDTVGLDQIVAFAVPDNAASRRVIDKLGMTYRGEADHFGLHLVEYTLSRQGWKADPPDRSA